MKKLMFLGVFLSLLVFGMASTRNSSIYRQNFDLTSISGREYASLYKPLDTYKPKKCGEVKHTDGEVMTVCLATFKGTTGGFYDADKELLVLSSFDQYLLIHELTHATTLHYYKKGYTDVMDKEVQEKYAYNAENLLMQIIAFKEDLNITPDLSLEKKLKLGIPTDVAINIKVKTATSTKVSTKKAGNLVAVSVKSK